MKSLRSWTVISLVVVAALCRLLPHPGGFAPMTALAIFAGASFQSRRWAPFVALGALLLSDALLQLTYLAGWQPNWGFYDGQWVIYASTFASVLIGLLIRRNRNIGTVGMATLAGSIQFFLVTNFAYIYGADSIHPQTLQGVIQSYVAGLPFFGRSLLGDAFYATMLFGTFALAEARFPVLQQRKPAPIAV